MKQLSVLIKPASALCNLRCKYCFYADISSLREVRCHPLMSKEIMEKMIDQIYIDLDEGDHINFAFQGGEPTLIGTQFYRNFIAYVNQQAKKVKVNYRIQTNGTHINEEWCQLFSDNNFLVGLSIDGPSVFHNRHRVLPKDKPTYKRISESKKMFDQYGVEYNILSVLTKQLASEPEAFYQFLQDEEIDYVQIIPCLAELGSEGSEFSLNPSLFASFYKSLFQLWYEDLGKTAYISIKLFEDIYDLVHFNVVSACGMLGQCVNQYVIEANGDVYPCDFYCLDSFKLGNILDKTLFELRGSRQLTNFLCFNKQVSNYCEDCPFLRMCYGGCKRMRHAMYLNEDENYCGYQDFLSHHLQDILSLNYG